jgi:hypothetical protein
MPGNYALEMYYRLVSADPCICTNNTAKFVAKELLTWATTPGIAFAK